MANTLEGNGAFQREDSITLIDVGFTSIDENGVVYGDSHTPEYVAIGEDNDELSRERNDSTDSNKNVLGKTNITTTLGAQTTEIDPYKIRANDKLSYLAYMINKYDLKDDKAKVKGLEVFLGDKQAEGQYGAWIEDAIVTINSWGGDTSATQAPMVLNWCGNKTHGTFEPKTKKFTETKSA